MRYLIMTMTMLMLVSVAACGNGEQKTKGDHVWKEQTQAIDRAKEVEGMLQQRATQHLQQADDQSQ